MNMAIRIASVALLAIPALVTPCAFGKAMREADVEGGVQWPEISSLESWDDMVSKLRRATWALHEFDTVLGADGSGRRFSQDVDDALMTAQVVERLDELHARALTQQAAGDTAGFEKTLSEANRVLVVEQFRAAALYHYAQMVFVTREHRKLIDALVQRLPAAEQVAARATVPDPEARLRSGTLRAIKAPDADEVPGRFRELTLEGTAATDALNAKREKIARRVGEVDRANGVAPQGRDRKSPCPAPASVTSGSKRPSIVRSSMKLPEYPTESRRFDYSGRAVLAFHVSQTGCVNRTELVVPVGVPELDEAALDWGESVQFLPAEKDGKPVDASYTLEVTFKLAD